MTFAEIYFLALGLLYGFGLTLLAQHLWAKLFCWRRRRQARRELEAASARRIERLVTAIRQAQPEPLVKEVRDIDEAYMIARKTVCALRAEDKRRWFPGDPTGEVN